MKKLLLTILCAVALNAGAQSITNIIIGVDSNSVAWGKVNANNGTLVGWHNAEVASNAWLVAQVTNANGIVAGIVTSNFLQNSWQITLTNLNPLTFTGSNYIGQFSQLYSFNLVTPLLGGGGNAPPTNQFEELVISTNGTTWWAITNASGSADVSAQLAIFAPVYVAVIGAVGNAGALTINGLNQTNLYGRTNALIGEELQVSIPVNPADAATKQYVDQNRGTTSPWTTTLDASGITHCTFSFETTTLADLSALPNWIQIDGLVADSTHTNVLLKIAQTNLVSGWQIYSSTNLLAPLIAWNIWTNYVATTNTGEATFTIPINFHLTAQYFLAQATGTNWATFNQPVSAPQFKLTPFTPSHSTNTTMGYGAGLLAVDTNYIYISVGTNNWLRVAIPTNTW